MSRILVCVCTHTHTQTRTEKIDSVIGSAGDTGKLLTHRLELSQTQELEQTVQTLQPTPLLQRETFGPG